jgi:hypothetical protein
MASAGKRRASLVNSERFFEWVFTAAIPLCSKTRVAVNAAAGLVHNAWRIVVYAGAAIGCSRHNDSGLRDGHGVIQ